MAKIVYAKTTCGVLQDGEVYRLIFDQPWDGDDPIVAHYPYHFSDTPMEINHTLAKRPAPSPAKRLERAIRNPGEPRNGTEWE